MYYPYFITYIVIGLAISLVVFFWALSRGQFRDQQRARFLPLQGEDLPPVRQSRLGRFEIYALLALAVLGLAASAARLLFALYSGGSG
jgi:cbb3-type cytochrome oxidase maturation protein